MEDKNQKLTLTLKTSKNITKPAVKKIRRIRYTADGKPIFEVPSTQNKNKYIQNRINKNQNKQQPKPVKEVKKAIPPTPPKKKKGPSQILPKIRMPVMEAIEELSIYWPNLFPNKQLRPLQVGIKEQLIEDMRNNNLEISRKKITRCLGGICHSLEYRDTLVLGTNRFDKDGEVCGVVDQVSFIDNILKIEKIKRQKIKLKELGLIE